LQRLDKKRCLKYLFFTCEEKFQKICALNFGVKEMGSHQNHSCVTLFLNGNNSTSTHGISMCNASSEISH